MGTTTVDSSAAAASAATADLERVMNESTRRMAEVMKSSINYQTAITEVTTFLGQVAARAAKQTPQG